MNLSCNCIERMACAPVALVVMPPEGPAKAGHYVLATIS